jgi:hypothetical protein
MFETVIEQLLTLLATALTGVLVALAVKALKKVGISLEAEQQAKLEYYAAQGINMAKEEAARRVKAGLDRLTPQQKEQMAVDHVMDNVPKADPIKVSDTVLATLPQLGEGAAAPPKA